jgi:hypothetical protein
LMVQHRSIDSESVEGMFASLDFRIRVLQSDSESIP